MSFWMPEYFNWLEQEAEEQRREERQGQAERFLPMRDFIGTCFMCGDEIPTGAYCSELCRKEHESIIEARPWDRHEA